MYAYNTWKWKVLWSTVMVKFESSSSSMPTTAARKRTHPRRTPLIIFSFDWNNISENIITHSKYTKLRLKQFKLRSIRNGAMSPFVTLINEFRYSTIKRYALVPMHVSYNRIKWIAVSCVFFYRSNYNINKKIHIYLKYAISLSV